MTKFIKPAAIFLTLMALAQGSQAQGDAQAGAAKTEICAACHGADGNSAAPMYPKLAGLGEKYIFKQLQDIKSRDRIVPEMTGMLDGYSEQDLLDASAYYASQAMQLSGAQQLQVKVNTGDEVDALNLGREIYRFGNPETGVPACSGCHSPTGLGNAPAGFPRLGGQFPDYVAKQLRDFRAGERVNDDQLVMRNIAEHMSEAEIVAVANYIAGLYAGERNQAAQ